MTGAEIRSFWNGFRLQYVARIVTAPTGADVHSRLGVEINPKFWSEYSYFGKFHAHIWDWKMAYISGDNFYR